MRGGRSVKQIISSLVSQTWACETVVDGVYSHIFSTTCRTYLLTRKVPMHHAAWIAEILSLYP